jgi:hypothetical protein
MHRALTSVIFGCAILAAALWGEAAQFLHGCRRFTCGNVVTDPFLFLANVVGPISAVCAVILVRECIKARRWPSLSLAALAIIVATSAGLVYEGFVLYSYSFPGIPDCIWWLPWRWQ